MKKYYYLPILFTLVFAACNKHLEVEPVSSITKESFFKTENDVKGALNGMYARLRGEANLTLFVLGEARSEVMTNSIAGTLGYEKYYNNSLTTTNAGPTWGGMYGILNTANLILKYTPAIPYASESAKNTALAEAYTMRAFVYFVLARTHGGVPLRTEPTESYDPATIQMARATEAEVFALIKSDINQAITLFPTNTVSSGRARWSKPAANALKADIYLWTGKRLNGGTADFTTALNAINDLQAAPGLGLLPKYADIFDYSKKGNNEVLMAIRFLIGEASNQVFAHNMYSSSTAYPAYVPQSQRDSIGVAVAGNGNVWRLTEDVRNQFTIDDQRRAATFLDLRGPGANEYYTNYGLKFAGTVQSGTRYLLNDYILYRYADVLLMKAEAKNALGQDPSTEINLVRQRAYGANFAAHQFVNGTKQANDEAILKERLLELATEGKRWWDLVRFGKAFELVPSLQGKESEPHLLYWPIGVGQITREPLVEEVEGWD